MKLKSLMLTATSLIAFAIVACSEVVFPTPLPTATPAPTATPIVFPTPLPTATPFALPSPVPTATPAVVVFPTPLPTPTPIALPSPVPTATPAVVVFPTPLPTATPITLPSPVPTATPAVVVFPTPLPTATPVPAPFASISDVEVLSIFAVKEVSRRSNRIEGWGIGFGFAASKDECAEPWVCILTAEHVAVKDDVKYPIYSWPEGHGWFRLSDAASHSNDLEDVAVIRTESVGTDGITRFEVAPKGTQVKAGDMIRVATIDMFSVASGREIVTKQRVIDGMVASVFQNRYFVITGGDFVEGHSGSVVLNTDMQVIGMLTAVRRYDGFQRYRVRHVDVIRDLLCDWGYLVGSDCR